MKRSYVIEGMFKFIKDINDINSYIRRLYDDLSFNIIYDDESKRYFMRVRYWAETYYRALEDVHEKLKEQGFVI